MRSITVILFTLFTIVAPVFAQTDPASRDAFITDGDTAYANGNYEMALIVYATSCRYGSATACVRTGDTLEAGVYEDVAGEFAQSLEYYNEACRLNDPIGCARGAVFYDRYQRQCSVDDGTVTDPGACIELGLGYTFGHGGLELNRAKAEAEFQKACTVDDPYGCYNLGALYFQGLSGEPNGELAEVALQKACDLGFGPGCSLLGTVYAESMVAGHSQFEATAMWDRGCQQGDLDTCLFLGETYAQTPEIEGSGQTAVSYYQMGCDASHHASCRALAYALVKGELVPQNKPAASELFDRLCEAGDVPVCNDRYLLER